MKDESQASASAVAVPLRWGRRLRRQPQLRSTATAEGQVRERLDSRATLLGKRTVNQKYKRHRVTPLLAQRITLPGNSYFWRTAIVQT